MAADQTSATNDTGYASDVCDYSVAPKKKDSPTMRGIAQIKLDDSYVQQKRPVSMVSPSIKPMSPSLESSLCDRRQQLIQHRAKTFMGDNGNKNAYDNNSSASFINSSFNNNNNYNNNSSYNPASLTNRSDFISGFTSAAAIIEAPKSTAAHLPYFCSQPVQPYQPEYQNDFYGDYQRPHHQHQHELTLTMLETYAVNNPAYIPPTNHRALPFEAYSDHFDPVYFQANENENENETTQMIREVELTENRTRTPSRNSKSNSGVRAKIARRKLMRQANSVDSAATTHGMSDPDGSEAYDEEDSVEEKQDSEPMNDFQSLKPKAVSTLSVDETPLSGDCTPETARKNWNFRFANIKQSFAASEEDIAAKSRSPSLHHVASEAEERGRNKFKSISPTKRGSFSTEYSSPSSERAQSKEDKNKLNAAMTASSKVANADSGSLGQLGGKRFAQDMFAQSKSKQPTPVRETLTSGRLSKSVPREAYDDNRAEVLGLVKSSGGEGQGPIL